jgi:hypothetical protein
MIYLRDGWNPDENYPPMSGTRIGHEMMTEDVMCVKIQYAQQTFRSDRRELSMVHSIGPETPERDSELWDEVMDCGQKAIGRRPLIRHL